jgi:hypothetical protein
VTAKFPSGVTVLGREEGPHYRAGSRDDTLAEMASAVRARYDLAEDEVETTPT